MVDARSFPLERIRCSTSPALAASESAAPNSKVAAAAATLMRRLLISNISYFPPELDCDLFLDWPQCRQTRSIVQIEKVPHAALASHPCLRYDARAGRRAS